MTWDGAISMHVAGKSQLVEIQYRLPPAAVFTLGTSVGVYSLRHLFVTLKTTLLMDQQYVIFNKHQVVLLKKNVKN
jgi:hypothetical protein